jgi:hypothetical protein
MRYWIILFAALAVSLASTNARADEGKLPILEAEYYFRKVYPTLQKHKAMAVGLSGSFSASWDYGSDKEAAKHAVASCRKDFTRLTRRDGNESNCRLAVVGNKPLEEDVLSLASWQVAAPGIDQPLSKGERFLVPNGKARGILIYVHGCDGMASKEYNSTWGSFYNSLGLDYYAPDSFGDVRPRTVCGRQVDNGFHLTSEVYRLRIAQTHRTIEKLRKENPGKPIYLWGHSEGGLIVQAIEAKVAGIIVSGNECGVFNMPVAAASNVPFLYVLGAMDTYIDGVKYPFTEKSLQGCQKLMGKRKWKVAVIPDNGHTIWPWRETAAKAIAKFAGGTWRNIEPLPKTEKIEFTPDIKRELEIYRKNFGHKAFAVSPDGRFAWNRDMGYAEDAAQSALYECAKHHGVDIFAVGRHHCALIDIDGQDQQRAK